MRWAQRAGLWGVPQVAARLHPDRPARIATLFPDSGYRYLSTLFNDDWMRARGFVP